MLPSSYKSLTDNALVCRMAKDDHMAYTEVYDRYAGLLYMHARKKINDRDVAKDLVHELFASLWINRAALPPDTVLHKYLYTAIRYKVINFFARKKLEQAYLATLNDMVEQDDAMPDHLVRERELQRLIEQEVNQLPKKMRTVFQMSRELHLSHKEIAQRLELSEATVKKQVNNALKVLRAKLGIFLSQGFRS